MSKLEYASRELVGEVFAPDAFNDWKKSHEICSEISLDRYQQRISCYEQNEKLNIKQHILIKYKIGYNQNPGWETVVPKFSEEDLKQIKILRDKISDCDATKCPLKERETLDIAYKNFARRSAIYHR